MTQPDTITRADVEALAATNQATLQRFAAENIAVDQGSLAGLYTETLATMLLGGLDEPARIVFEHTYHGLLAQRLEAVAEAAARSKLLQGVRTQTPPANLLINGR